MKLRKQEIVLIAALVLSVIITIWGIAFNRATLTVESELAPFEINLGNRQAECKSSPCSIKIKPRTYKATVQKTGYTEYNKEVTLERGDKVTLEYTPFPIPQLQPIETPEIISKAYMTTNERGDQVLMLRTEDRGDIVVSTFSNPLADPEVRVSPENDFAFVWDEASFPPAFFLVDINGKSKRVYPFGENKKPNDLEFLNSNQILIEREGQILLFDINLNDVFFYPIADLNHVLAFNNNQSLILSRSDLDEFAEPTADETDFFDIISTEGENIFDTPVVGNLKMFYFLKDQGQYIELFTLDERFAEPINLDYAIIDNETKPILQSMNNAFLIDLSLE